MASKTTYIPRFLLPQYGPLWRTTTRARTTFARASSTPEVGQVLVRYASRTTAASRAAHPLATSSRTGPSRASSSKSTAARAAKASAPTKKASSPASATPKTPTSKPAVGPTTPALPPATTAESTQKTETAIPDTTTPASLRGTDPSKPLVLEKPERFNPPSHGKRLPRSVPQHYGGAPTAEEAQARKTKQYPGLPPPENTWSHWFINSRGVHMFITLGTLTSLALYTFASNFKAKSPYADLIPPLSELPRHPLQYAGVCVDVLRMHEVHESAVTAEKRRRRVDDVAKRNEYRKAHGLEPATGWWGAKAAEPRVGVEVGAGAGAGGEGEGEAAPAADLTPEGKRKKLLGVF